MLVSPAYRTPAGVTPGHEMISGVRIPASYAVALARGKGAPLSLRKTTSVFSRSSRRSSSATIRPTRKSMRAISS